MSALPQSENYKSRHEREYLERLKQAEIAEAAEKVRTTDNLLEGVAIQKLENIATPLLDPRPTSALLDAESVIRGPMRTGYMERLIEEPVDDPYVVLFRWLCANRRMCLIVSLFSLVMFLIVGYFIQARTPDGSIE